jgi:hypothetical protein
MENVLVYTVSERLGSINALPTLVLLSAFAVAARLFYGFFYPTRNDINKYLLVNGRKPWSWFVTEQKAKFVTDARGLIDHGLKTVSFRNLGQTKTDFCSSPCFHRNKNHYSYGLIADANWQAGKAFRLQTDDGIQLVLAGEYADGLRSNPDLNFGKISAEVSSEA